MNKIGESELIINSDGSIFHLKLKPEHIAKDIILVGDPGRVAMISDFFDKVEHVISNREFITHTGTYKGKRISVIATGIGTDNIDIVLNELDALVNIDLHNRIIKEKKTILNFIRIGTSGALHEDIEVDSFLLSEMAVGFDGLLNFYANRNSVCNTEMENAFKNHTNWNPLLTSPYFVKSSKELSEKIGKGIQRGITISAPGFYGPQGRVLRLQIQDPEINDKIRSFRYNDKRITNYEMESSALFGLSALLGHQAATVCVIIANRYAKKYSKDYKPAVKNLIKHVLDNLVE
ncbi:MAG: nucleoside phosphorylase [Bacteroidales bacterium]|nr:nucleoside phosphorylase [Bacteroidales bacterium]HOL99038.1 nucleoside phosphorylase [Bacteroidales bacterium]HOM37361.1 nucleoside phosphorylase [Bacteroidales bacterium]HPD24890.1 nucleoside phosphorylase [Bacteroidales bacterium]HRT00607.1 nucleoside phosphorylase [Bacteroidales bacterium]